MRVLLVLLVLANLAYYALAQGWLEPIGLGLEQQREPQRLGAQLNAQVVRVLSPQQASAALAANAASAASQPDAPPN
jgi:hypothetical protein